MRNMSFSHTTEQIRQRTKTETRRLAWAALKPGERFVAVVKARGLKKGEHVERIAVLQCVSNRVQPLYQVTKSACIREGFPKHSPREFVRMFAA